MPLNPAVSALARKTISAAFEELDHTITPADSRDFPNTTLHHVRKAALDIENQLAARQSLRNMRRLEPLFKGLEHYSKAVDILCNGTPYLAWIWAPITLILRVASEYIEAFEKIIQGYSRIAEALKRFDVLSNALSKNVNFQQTLAVFYADILQFHKHAYRFVRRSSWKLLFLTSWGRFQRRFNNILENMERHGELVDKEAQAYHISGVQQFQQDIYAWKEESQERTRRFEEEHAAKQYQSILSWLKADESDQLAIFDSISAEGSKYPGTCNWATKNKKIISFLQPKPETPILWLQGGPGSGKSVLSAQLVNFMRAAKMFVICHFCTHSYASSITYEQILRSVLLQVLQKDYDLIAHVYEEFILGKKAPAIPALERLLHILLKSIFQEPRQNEHIWIVLDGLNECDTQKQASVATLVNQITSRTRSSVRVTCKILISSRISPTISSRLRKKQVISLTEEKESIGLAIKQYTSQRLKNLQEKFNQLHVNSDEVEDIGDEITKKSDGMFLYARLVLDFLDNKIFYKSCEVKASVNELPQKLSDFYGKILTQILVRLDPQSVTRVKSIFCWIAFAKRPLKKIEFLSAISFSAGEPDIAHLAPTYILDICGSLVEERRDNTLAFIHVSVKEFLESFSSGLTINAREAIEEHCIATITCLLSGVDVFAKPCQNDTKYLRVARGLHGFHVYSTEYWIEYLLSYATSSISHSTTVVFDLAGRLAEELYGLGSRSMETRDTTDPVIQDKRLAYLHDHLLHQEVERALCARSLKRLESGLHGFGLAHNLVASTDLLSQDGISIMLTSYEQSVKFLLAQNDYPGVSAEELETFKSQFRACAYTCRLTSCPRATLGFESEILRLDHEMTHLPRIRCSFPGCQSPPFVSAQSLKIHEKRYHVSQPARKWIRVSNNLANNPHTSTIKVLDSDPRQISQASYEPIDQSEQIRNTPHNKQDATPFIPITKKVSLKSQGPALLEFKENLGPLGTPYASTPASRESTPTYDMYMESNLLGCIKAPKPLPLIGFPSAPPPPQWLLDALDKFRRDPSFVYDTFDACMLYIAVDPDTGTSWSCLESGQAYDPYIRFYFVPRIRCDECSGSLYAPGDLEASTFGFHLQTNDHRASVHRRVTTPGTPPVALLQPYSHGNSTGC
ncbi:hypothetical protein M434DRAFT_394351 [Hypoxylon sp. CO27-5]|nr:hypothetical protein M434DRAFT_394351 [Hypoxylon sp. CO27-5]